MAEATVIPSDQELVERTLDGEVSAFNQLVDRWENSLYKFVVRYLGDPEEAKDICQEAFVRAYEHLDSFRGDAKFSSWLYQIARNLCRSRFRKQQSRPKVSIDDDESGQLRTLPDDRATPAEVTLTRERATAVQQAIGELTEAQRTVVILKQYHGLKFREIAEILELPESTVKSRLYSGLDSLAELLGHLESGSGPR